MTQTQFIERIKAIMDEAKHDGWTVSQIQDYATETVLEWVEEESVMRQYRKVKANG